MTATCPLCASLRLFVTNTTFEPALLEYGAAYDNDQSCPGCFEGYVDGLIDGMLARGIRGKTVAVRGAGAKGVTFLNLLDPDGALVDCVVDVNPRKQGRVLPGTGHAIVAPAALVERRVKDVVLMNPNDGAEVRSTLDQLGAEVSLHVGSAS